MGTFSGILKVPVPPENFMKKYLQIIWLIICGLSICCAPWEYSFARESENLDEIIQGFEEEEQKHDDELEDLMEDFKDETPEGEKKDAEEKDDVLEGFDEDTLEKAVEKEETEEKPSTWSLNGELELATTYNFAHKAPPPGKTDWRGLSMLRPELELTLKKKFSESWQGQISTWGYYDLVYSLRGRDNYTSEVLDSYEKELQLRDTFIQGSLTEKLDTKIGRQVVVWGTLDNLRVTDVLNPLDLRVPGLTDIDDLRLPVTMAKLDYYFGDWNLAGMVIPEIRFSKLPVFGSDFYPSPVPLPPEDMPEDGFGNPEYAAALTGIFSGWDIAFYWANIYDDQSYSQVTSPGPPPQLILKHARINMLGAAFNIAAGNWLLKAESAWLDGIEYTNTPGVKYSRIDLGAGIEYSGFQDATLSLEVANRHINGFNEELKLPPNELREDEFQWVARIMKNYLNDTLTLTLLASTFGIKADDGAFQRLDAEYDVTDAISIRGGVVFYQSGDKGKFKNIGDNDRLFLEVKYNF